jgi:hypothetical protein
MLDPLVVSVAQMLHQSRYDRGIMLMGMRGSVLTTLVPILFTQRSSSVDGVFVESPQLRITLFIYLHHMERPYLYVQVSNACPCV